MSLYEFLGRESCRVIGDRSAPRQGALNGYDPPCGPVWVGPSRWAAGAGQVLRWRLSPAQEGQGQARAMGADRPHLSGVRRRTPADPPGTHLPRTAVSDAMSTVPTAPISSCPHLSRSDRWPGVCTEMAGTGSSPVSARRSAAMAAHSHPIGSHQGDRPGSICP